MKTIRIGNDFTIEWTVTRMGEDSSLEGLGLHLYIDTPRGRMEVGEYLLDGNKFRFMYPGSRQLVAGVYGLTLTINEGKDNMSAVDACKVFRLVESGCSACGDALYGEGIVVTCNSDIVVPANGLSAYETAVLHGFEGTEEEWLASLKAPAEDAADEVREQAKAWAEAESGRVEAEKQRVAAEDGRATAESERVKAEQGRTEAEAVRVAEENTRKEQEAARVTAESGRVEAETARKEAETGRVKAEEERVSAERTRSSNETSRQEAEQARATAENRRQEAESGRVSAEGKRSEAETGRETAESRRNTAEQSRNQVFARLATESATATASANKAANNANLAAILASENVLALDFDQTTGLLSAVVGQDGSAFESGEITDEGDVILTFDYQQ